ncbi:MAG: hypothetical protein QOE33_3432 [Acidobacteriota bacterium]|nr:hypothetical protein [Acidobacteriota bacterium]
MRLRASLILMFVALMLSASAAISAEGLQDKPAQAKADPVSGDWDVTFEIQGMTVPANFKLKLDGDKVTGTAYSDHTGAGTLSKGSWVDNKLNFTLDFAKHESIVVNGMANDGKLGGEFLTEGMKGTWQAKKK